MVVIANPSDLVDYNLVAVDVEAELERAEQGLGGIPQQANRIGTVHVAKVDAADLFLLGGGVAPDREQEAPAVVAGVVLEVEPRGRGDVVDLVAQGAGADRRLVGSSKLPTYSWRAFAPA